MRNAMISGLGFHVPERVVTNTDLITEYGIDTTHEWILKRTGIEERRFVADGEGSVELSVPAAERAIADSGLDRSDIEMIVYATMSPQHAFPGNAPFLQERLGLDGVPTMDIRNQCTGYLYALATADSMIKAGMYRHVLVVGCDVHSTALDLTTEGRTVASLFGDGAGATVLSATDEDRGVRQLYLGADGKYTDVLMQKVWDVRGPSFLQKNENGDGIVPRAQMYAHMQGKLVFKHAVEKMTASLLQVCWNEQIKPTDLDLVFFHQANLRINQYVARQLGLSDEQVPHNIERYGNTTAGTLPILMTEMVQSGRLKPGMKVGLAAFGSGFTWGAAIIDW